MKMIAIALTVLTALMALRGRRGVLRGVILMALLPWPLAILVGGLRSAVFGSELLVFFAAAMWIAGYYGRDQKTVPTPMRMVLILLFSYCVLTSFTGAVGGIRGRLFTWVGWNTYRLLGMGLSFLIPASMILTRREALSGLRMCLFGIAALAALGTAQAVGIIPALPTLALAEAGRGDVSQVSMFMLGFTRTGMGGMCLIGITVSLGLMSIRAIRIPTGLIVGGLCIALLLSSHSRSAFFGLAAMGLAIPLVGRGARVRNFLFVLGGMIVSYLVITNVPAIAERFGTVASTEGVERALEQGHRLQAWRVLLEWFARHPAKLLVGVGYEGWVQHIHLKVIPLTTAHNAYLEALAELGFIGGAMWLWFWIAMTRQGWRNYRSAQKTDNLGGSLLVLMVGLAAASMGDVFTYPVNQTQALFRLLMPVLGIYVGYFRGLEYEWSLAGYADEHAYEYEDNYDDEQYDQPHDKSETVYAAPEGDY